MVGRRHTYTHIMFGAFRITSPLSGGLLWKIPWRLSKFQKRRHRLRLRAVDDVVSTVDAALAKQGETVAAVERWKAEMPTEAEMLPRDKYTMFDRKEKRYRKGIHSMLLPNQPASLFRNGVSPEEVAWLTFDVCRAAQVDESLSEIEPSRILNDDEDGCRMFCLNGEDVKGGNQRVVDREGGRLYGPLHTWLLPTLCRGVQRRRELSLLVVHYACMWVQEQPRMLQKPCRITRAQNEHKLQSCPE